jgi:serine/threonine protein kinase/beta-lactam-binding protein with PASTA domain
MIGRLIDGRYEVRSRIARGGMATVYLATDLRLERRVAIKIMHGHLADDSTFKTRFVQEARSAARLAHPNVVNVFDQGQDDDMAYLVMEYLPGLTLRELVKNRGKLTPEQTIDIMSSVLSGLAAAHKAGIVHRDLKPENVLLADDGRIKIGDFGLARASTANTATGQALLGTIAYLSPELVTRGIADKRSDIYALGIMMYEMLTGEQPFQGEQPMQIAYQHANDTVPTPRSQDPTIPVEFDDMVLWATARDPEQRPRDAQEMLDHLIEIARFLHDPDTQVTSVLNPTLTQHTMVMKPIRRTDTNETRAIGNHKPRHRTGPIPSANVTKLAQNTAARKRRGPWLLGAVLLAAALAGGTGWYFNAGPGAMITVPVVNGESQDVAIQRLIEAKLVAGPTRECTSPTRAYGLVVSSDPHEGDTVSRGSTVSLCLSTGPQLLPVPHVIGDSEEDAREQLAAFTVTETQSQFSDEEAGIVLQLFDASGQELGEEYGEQQAITLLISAGPIPNITGMTTVDATSTLDAIGLSIAYIEEVFSDSIENGFVVAVVPQTDPIRPGDKVALQLSKGPELVSVPDVVGQTWTQAKDTLMAAGFDINYNFAADLAPGLVRVTATNPVAGAHVEKSSTISVSF